ncbi:hypothetical protein R3P38DRAFT_3182820 [Favolaschia claudopus]|uniref:Uncharacterized protein n=1 Tax=Favolaschia claudopus TaxID=2862362 RepID=A0AAW0CCN4_9AGAR
MVSAQPVKHSSGSPAPTEDSPCFPLSLLRLEAVYTELNRALCHALATSPVSPDPNTGTVLNILDHMSLERHYLSCLRIDDLRRLCWICEWDTEDPSLEATASVEEVDNDDPFLPIPNDWIRGAMGITISPTTQKTANDFLRMVLGYGTFSTASTGSALSNTNHTRRALPLSVVATAVHKSSSAPISATEVLDSLTMLADLCPWFLKHLEIGAEKWLEMPGRSGDASQAPGEPKGAHEHGLRRARGIIRRNLLDVDF